MQNKVSAFLSTRLLPVIVLSLYLLGLPRQIQAQAVTSPWVEPCYVETEVTRNEGTISEATSTYKVPTIQGMRCIVANLLSIGTSGVGLAGFVMFIVGSFTYLLSGGNNKGTENAKQTLTFAVVGIVVALSAFIILNVISAFTGVNRILQFEIPTSDSGLPGPGLGGGAGTDLVDPN